MPKRSVRDSVGLVLQALDTLLTQPYGGKWQKEEVEELLMQAAPGLIDALENKKCCNQDCNQGRECPLRQVK